MPSGCSTHSLTRYLRSTLRISDAQLVLYTPFDTLFTQYPKDFGCPAGLHTQFDIVFLSTLRISGAERGLFAQFDMLVWLAWLAWPGWPGLAGWIG